MVNLMILTVFAILIGSLAVVLVLAPLEDQPYEEER